MRPGVRAPLRFFFWEIWAEGQSLLPLGQAKNYRTVEKVLIRSVNRYAKEATAPVRCADGRCLCERAI
jgi:hypothetical protein